MIFKTISKFSKRCNSPFAAFANEYGFKRVTSSSRYTQSIGLGDGAVKVMDFLERMGGAYKILLAYKTSQLKNGYSPAELLLSRRLRTTLPVFVDSPDSAFREDTM